MGGDEKLQPRTSSDHRIRQNSNAMLGIYQMVLGQKVYIFLFSVQLQPIWLLYCQVEKAFCAEFYFRMSAKRCVDLSPFMYCTESNVCANCFMSRKYHGCGLRVGYGIAYVNMLARCARVLNESQCVPVVQLQDNNLSFCLETKNDISIVMISYLYMTCFCVVNDIRL